MGVLTKNVDVRDSKQVTELITHTHSKEGRIDILFNNADIAFGSKLENVTEDRFEDHIAGHLFGCIYGMRAAIPTKFTEESLTLSHEMQNSICLEPPHMAPQNLRPGLCQESPREKYLTRTF